MGDSDEELAAKLYDIARRRGRLEPTIARLKKLDELPDDPLVTETLIGWLYEARWPGAGAKAGWTAVFERLRTLRDARAIEPLRALPASKPAFLGKKNIEWIFAEATSVADELEKTAPPSKLPSIAIKAKKGANADTLSLVQRVFDSPDDDDLRRVVADELLEHGDPWGEFIQLGFLVHEGKATVEQKQRASAIVKKNTATIVGPIAKIAKVDSRGFEKGFLSWVCTDATMRPRAEWEAAAASAYWSTVERLELNVVETPKWFVKAMGAQPMLKRLRTVSFNRYRSPIIVLDRTTTASPWRVLEMKEPSTYYSDALSAWLAMRPRAERDRIEIADDLSHAAAARDVIAAVRGTLPAS